MRYDQRLIPFLGGLAIGGIGGQIIDNNRINYGYYPNPYPYYNNVYPQYNYYPPVNNTPYYAYPSYMNTNVSKVMGDTPSIVTYAKMDERMINQDLSFVPIYRQY